MSKIITTVQTFLRPYYIHIITIVLLIIFSYVGYYSYKKYVKPAMKKDLHKDVANANKRKRTADVRFFFTDWCPHCQKSKPEWEEFKQQFSDKNKLINGYRVNCIDIDCSGDIDQDSEIMNLMNKFKIESYPTINLTLDGDETIEFDSKISKETLDTFVNTILNE